VGTTIVDRWDNERPVEKVVVLLARRLGNQHAAMTGCTLQEAMFVGIRWAML
jgi:hypothetical protein